MDRKAIQQVSDGHAIFTSVLTSLDALEHLTLTHNGMYGEVALKLVEAYETREMSCRWS